MARVNDPSARMTLAQMRAYLDNPPREAEQTSNGMKPVRRVKNLADHRETALRQTMLDRYTGLHARAVARVEDADETLELVEERIESWTKQMKAGRLSPEDVQKNIAQLPEVLKAINEEYDAAAGDAQSAHEFIDTEPADFERAELDRFPRLADSLPVVSESWLRGEPGAPDPLGDES